jgi:hypothetical protein
MTLVFRVEQLVQGIKRTFVCVILCSNINIEIKCDKSPVEQVSMTVVFSGALSSMASKVTHQIT